MTVSDKRLRELALEGVIWNGVDINMSIYPAAVHGGEHAYEKRTEWMEGWNECGREFSKNYGILATWLSKIPAESRLLVEDLLLANTLDLRIDDGECFLSINCNDVFFWGCADGEGVTLDELPSLQECLALDPKTGAMLWIARKRKERPQGAVYTYIDRSVWPLFHEAGPEREIGLGNPYAPGEYGKESSNAP